MVLYSCVGKTRRNEKGCHENDEFHYESKFTGHYSLVAGMLPVYLSWTGNSFLM